ncbi:winged helix-turn-helix domain-containing protein [Cyanobacteria bacterium FACHB-502]|nr:winged helix-turn-helix domain-containing protein [Cyanobacteria bacterium FACHB-502]
MEKRTIAQAAIEVLKEAKQPMTVAEITQAILDKGLYTFNTKDERGMVRRAIERRCEGIQRKGSVSPKYFIKFFENQFSISDEVK